MSVMKEMIKKILSVLHIYNRIDECDIEYLRGRGVQIGDHVDIINSVIDGGHGYLISIGNDVTITHATLLTRDASTKKTLGYSKVGRIDVGNNVFIGYGALILPNTRIGNNVIIGAGAVVARNIPDNSVAVGNPATVVCTWEEYMGKQKELLATRPVYDTYANEKTEQEKSRMKRELRGIIGFTK